MANSEDGEAEDVSLFIDTFHQRIVFCLAHEARLVGEENLKEVSLCVIPDFYVLGHRRLKPHGLICHLRILIQRSRANRSGCIENRLDATYGLRLQQYVTTDIADQRRNMIDDNDISIVPNRMDDLLSLILTGT